MRVLHLDTLFPALLFAPVVWGGTVQLPNLQVPASAAAHRQDVVTIFNESYDAYRHFAFGHDQLNPLSVTVTDPRNGWGASIVDAMSSMVGDLPFDDFQQALAFSSHIDFEESKVNETVSFFETTIRYVGGLISAYELSGKKYPVLVDQAKRLADRLSLAFSVENSTFPFGDLDFTSNSVVNETGSIATSGTLTLEWGKLTEYTGNAAYRALAEKSVLQITSNPKPLPGLPAQGLDPNTNLPVGGYVTWGGGSDSYFEYLIKWARLSNTDDDTFANNWRTAVDTSIKILVKRSTVGNHLYLADFDDDRKIRHIGSHLACFYGGNWLLGGKLTNNDTIVNIALELNEACWNTYAGDATGIGPEAFAFISPDGNFTGGDAATPAQLAFYREHGYYITDGIYIERPEVLESNFYAWRVTGDTKYLDRAASAVASFNRFLKTPHGFAGFNDVNNVTSGQVDDMESFWFAEVLKYLYLTFDDPSHISLDDFVFNTEGHPFIAPPAKATYGTGILPPDTTPFTVNPGPLPAVSPIVKLPLPTGV
ncbi:glycoside hydrolase family 47 protein [Amylostereum chailletii]|nr:glycoside hydrolase family 47 protein [Amylostereum chailletii]